MKWWNKWNEKTKKWNFNWRKEILLLCSVHNFLCALFDFLVGAPGVVSFVCLLRKHLWFIFVFLSMLHCLHTSSTYSIIKTKVTCGLEISWKKNMLSWNRYYRLLQCASVCFGVHSYFVPTTYRGIIVSIFP